MKKEIVIFCFFVLMSCKSNLNKGLFDVNYKVFKKEIVSELTLFHGVYESDTVLFVMKKLDYESCKNKYKYISKIELKQITFYKIDKDTINFSFKIKDANNQFLVNSSIGEPGKKRKSYYSYKSFPYLIENCSSFK